MLRLTELGLLESESIPVFEEATQTAAHFLNMPICFLSILEAKHQRFKSAIGLSRLGLMNTLATTRQLPRQESFCCHVVDSQQILMIPDTLSHPSFASNFLTQQYGVRSYLGVPLITASGCCIGTLAVIDLTPRQFSPKDTEFLELTARWSISEFERQRAGNPPSAIVPEPPAAPLCLSIANQLKVELLGQLTQELRTPLTSVMGMASVLTRNIYGPLTTKQREYLDIIHRSGQYLLSLVNEILELSELMDSSPSLNLTAVDIEMLCQQAINTLEQAAQRREQHIRLSVEPGRRIWLLDKDKLRQMLYHLVFSVIQASMAGSIVRIHASRRDSNLNVAVWITHPWLGEGLPDADLRPLSPLTSIATQPARSPADYYQAQFEVEPDYLGIAFPPDGAAVASNADPGAALSNHLGITLCLQLAELHGGRLTIQGGAEVGYRYVISLPQLSAED
jgi:signal transduction histidine kinase